MTLAHAMRSRVAAAPRRIRSVVLVSPTMDSLRSVKVITLERNELDSSANRSDRAPNSALT